MTMSDIRKTLNLLESVETPKAQNSQIDEATPMGFFKTLATGAAAIFSDVAVGKLDTGRAANRIHSNYMRYLGSIGKKPTSGTIGDLYSFLAKTGSNQRAMMGGLRTGTGLPINTENDLKKYWDTIVKDKNKVSRTIMVYTQNAAKLPEKDREPEDFAKQAQTGAVSVDRITAAKAKEIKPTQQPTAAAPTDEIETAIKTTIGAQDVKTQSSSIDAALKALGE
jgi:hypothetical protein